MYRLLPTGRTKSSSNSISTIASGTDNRSTISCAFVTDNKADLNSFTQISMYSLDTWGILQSAMWDIYPDGVKAPPSNDISNLPLVTDYYHEEVINIIKRDAERREADFEEWRNKYLKNICECKYASFRINSPQTKDTDEIDILNDVNFDNAYLEYCYRVFQMDSGKWVIMPLYFEQLVFCDGSIEEAKYGNDYVGYVTEGQTEYYAWKRRIVSEHISYRKKILPEDLEINVAYSGVGKVYDKEYGAVDMFETTEETADYAFFIPAGSCPVEILNAKNYNKIKYCATSCNIEPYSYRDPIFAILKRTKLRGRNSGTHDESYRFGFIKLSDLSFEDLTKKTASEFLWGWDNINSDNYNNFLNLGSKSSYRNYSIFKGPLCKIDTSNWQFEPVLDSRINIHLSAPYYGNIDPHITEKDEVLYDLELEDKSINYKGEDYEIINGVAKNISHKFLPTYDSWRYSLKTLHIPIWKYNEKTGFTITLKKLPHHFTGTIRDNIGNLRWNTIPISGSHELVPTITASYSDKIQTAQFNFKLEFTGMGNDPCKECCCDCEIEPKKYKTVVEFTATEPLQGRVIITPQDLEYEWQENTLILMLEKGQEVTVDNIPAGTKYEISVENSEEYDECDENEYSVSNSSGTIGENSEGEPEDETEITVTAQAGETVQQYLDRLRQRGYEQLAENLKLENVEFTLQDERIKLGDLVTVDLPEFDFKAVVRVTGVKLKSQGNQTIRTISVGTPLKILRRSKI